MSDPWEQGGTNPFQETEEDEEVEEVSALEGIELTEETGGTGGTALAEAAQAARAEVSEFFEQLGAEGGGEQGQPSESESTGSSSGDDSDDSSESISGVPRKPEIGKWRAGYDREGERESHQAKGELRRQWLEGDESNAPCPVKPSRLEWDHLDVWEPAIEDDILANYIKDEVDKLGIEPSGGYETFRTVTIGSQLDLLVNWEMPPPREQSLGNVYELYIAPGALIVAVMYRYNGPYGYSVMRAIYDHFEGIETLRHIFFQNIDNQDTGEVIDNIVREVPAEGERGMKKSDWKPVVHEYGTDDYLTLLGTKIGQVASYLLMERLALGTRRFSQIATWRIRKRLVAQIRFEIEPIESDDEESPEGTGERPQGTKEVPPRSPTPMEVDPVAPEAEPMEVEEQEEDAEGDTTDADAEGETVDVVEEEVIEVVEQVVEQVLEEIMEEDAVEEAVDEALDEVVEEIMEEDGEEEQDESEEEEEEEEEQDNDVEMAEAPAVSSDLSELSKGPEEPEEEEEENNDDKMSDISDISSDLTDLSDVADRLDTTDDDRPWRKRKRENEDKDPDYEEPAWRRRRAAKTPPAPVQPLRRSKRVLELRAKKGAKRG